MEHLAHKMWNTFNLLLLYVPVPVLSSLNWFYWQIRTLQCSPPSATHSNLVCSRWSFSDLNSTLCTAVGQATPAGLPVDLLSTLLNTTAGHQANHKCQKVMDTDTHHVINKKLRTPVQCFIVAIMSS